VQQKRTKHILKANNGFLSGLRSSDVTPYKPLALLPMIFSRETLEKMPGAPKGKEMFCSTKAATQVPESFYS